ncbi:MAG TPA: sulfur carrier protein ThiS [Candidatus Brocadiia bacterium]|nr:sulfur carrier protein ThiS [Planctomycetota bacterium]MDO8091845.1 sulfur carrier protein ThiS [Candidatus Brocadiales bacterium]
MQIILNGETRTFPEGVSILELLEALKIDRNRVAVEVNLNIIPRRLHGETRLKENDKVEVVTFVGGG